MIKLRKAYWYFMFCKNCGKNLNTTSNFCPSCGEKVQNVPATRSQAQTPKVEVVCDNSPTYDTNLAACRVCGTYAPVKYVEFYQNIGMLVMRKHKSIKGKLCKKCINKYFWDFTLTDLLLGWWGFISFFVTIFYLLNNIGRYLTTLTLKDSYT